MQAVPLIPYWKSTAVTADDRTTDWFLIRSKILLPGSAFWCVYFAVCSHFIWIWWKKAHHGNPAVFLSGATVHWAANAHRKAVFHPTNIFNGVNILYPSIASTARVFWEIANSNHAPEHKSIRNNPLSHLQNPRPSFWGIYKQHLVEISYFVRRGSSGAVSTVVRSSAHISDRRLKFKAALMSLVFMQTSPFAVTR